VWCKSERCRRPLPVALKAASDSGGHVAHSAGKRRKQRAREPSDERGALLGSLLGLLIATRSGQLFRNAFASLRGGLPLPQLLRRELATARAPKKPTICEKPTIFEMRTYTISEKYYDNFYPVGILRRSAQPARLTHFWLYFPCTRLNRSFLRALGQLSCLNPQKKYIHALAYSSSTFRGLRLVCE